VVSAPGALANPVAWHQLLRGMDCGSSPQ